MLGEVLPPSNFVKALWRKLAFSIMPGFTLVANPHNCDVVLTNAGHRQIRASAIKLDKITYAQVVHIL